MQASAGTRRIGLFGGSFDPPHVGHLHVARAARGRFGLDRVVFVPAAEPPHKAGRALAPGADRLAMLRLLLGREPRCEVSDVELVRGGRSFTIDTVRALPAALGEPADCEIYLLLGSDNLPGLPQWREARELLGRVQPVVVRRAGALAQEISALAPELGEELARKLERGALDLDPVEVSSTELRDALPLAQVDARLVPPLVLDYIRARGLYGVPPEVSWLVPFAGAFVLTGLLVRLAPALGLLDRPESAPERKRQEAPVPRVGGIALALGLAALWQAGSWKPEAPLALLAAFAVGLADDRAPRGLPRALKFALEAGICALFAWQSPGSGALAFALAALALSAANTFDNADGALAALGCAALVPVVPGAAALLAGFLPWNLWLRTRAYLGDAGSHLLALLLACDPRSAIFLALPALDLARLAWVRLRSGGRPWVGDRRHLAHRLQARGLRPTAVVLVLLALASPACFLAPAWAAGATGLLFCAALALTPDPCPRPGSTG